MNTLIKIVITTVIGFFGTVTEVKDGDVKAQAYHLKATGLENYKMNGTGYCRFNEKSCIKFKNVELYSQSS